MIYFQLTPPNICGLVVSSPSGDLKYANLGPQYNSKIWASDGSSFTEYLTPEDAAAAALLIDPSYDLTGILGSIPYDVNAESGGGDYNYGDTVTLVYDVSSTDVDVSFAYQWKDGSGFPIAGETNNTLLLGGATPALAGTYACEVIATHTDGRSQNVGAEFSVAVGSVSGSFYLTRTSTNITAGLFTSSQGFDRELASIYLVDDALDVDYDALNDGFKTTGGQLGTGAQTIEFRVNGAYVATYTLPVGNGTYTYTF